MKNRMVFIEDGFGCRTNLHDRITKTYEVQLYYFDLWVSTYAIYWLTNVNEISRGESCVAAKLSIRNFIAI